MREFLTPSVPIYMYDGQGGHIVKTMGEVFFLRAFTVYATGSSLLSCLASSEFIWPG